MVVILALIFRNYWALAIGMVIGSLVGVLLSYGMHPYRPRFSLSRATEIWAFSQWLLLSRVGAFLNRKSDQFIVGGVAGSASMGNYHIAIEVSTTPTYELIMPLRRALFPNYARLLDDPPRFSAAVLKAVGVMAMLCLSAGFGMAAVAHDLVVVVFGEKWLQVVPLMQWLALFGAAAGMSLSFEIVLLVAGRTKLSAFEAWLQLAILIPVLTYVGHKWGIEEVAIARTCVAALFVPLMAFLVTRVCQISLLQVGQVLWRPLASALVMGYMVTLVHPEMPEAPALRLCLDILVGIAVYTIACLTLWRLAGRPDGAEQVIIAFVSNTYRSVVRQRDAAL
jgi:O-antigen/teichoic acid export membrane protein